MRTLATNSSNDIFIDATGSISIVSEVLAVGEVCKGRMQTRLNEMAFQFDEGVPFSQTAWIGTPNLQAFEAASRRILQEVENVNQVTSFTARVGGNVLRYDATIETAFGLVSINGGV